MNTSRITHPAQQSNFGLVAWLEETRVALPLKGVECQFNVTGDVACVELDQIYHQNAAKPLDCTYTFPLPAGAAVYRCEVHINGRVIRAKVEERLVARELYQKNKAEGWRAALVETERENLFTLSLGNAQPGDVIVVRFAWFQVLDRIADQSRLLVPTCPGVRYIPGKPLLRALSGRGTVDDTDQVPDASRITPPRIDALHPDAAYFSIAGRISVADVESGSASSPSHPVLVRKKEDAITVELAERGTVPDRDFVLSWREPKVSQLAPTAWQWREGKETYALVQLRAPEDVKVADGCPQDFYFLVDRSYSMSGAKWQKSCEALRAFVRLLGPEDRVWITLFESQYLDFNVAPMPAPQVLVDEGFRSIERIGTAGGTELLPAAAHVLEKITKHSSSRRANIILITDGQVGNEREIEDAFKSAANVTVHTFGIDTAVNDAFLKSLASQHRGRCWLQTPNDDIAGTITALGDRLRRPVLSKLVVEGSWETANGALPDVHAREVVTVALRGNTKSPVKITGCLPDGTAHILVVNPHSQGSEALKLLWARQRITALIASGKQAEAIAMARKHNLICEGAAFIAWDEQEQVPIAGDEVVQPVFEAHYAVQRSVSYYREPARAAEHSSTRFLAPNRSPRLSIDFDGTQAMIPPPARRRASAGPCFFASLSEFFTRPLTRIFRAGGKNGRGMGQARDAESERVRREAAQRAHLPEQLGELRKALQRERVPQADIERFIAWAESDDAVNRTFQLNLAMDLIARARQRFLGIAAFEQTVWQVLIGPPEALVQWANEFGPAFESLEAMDPHFHALKIKQSLIDRVAKWVAESGEIEPDRLGRIRDLLLYAGQGTFPQTSANERVKELLETTVAGAQC